MAGNILLRNSMKRDQIQFLSVVFLLMVCACSVTVGGMGDQAQTPPVTTPTLELQLPLKVWIFPEVPAPLQKRLSYLKIWLGQKTQQSRRSFMA